MGHEEERRLDISRAKSDENLLNEGADYSSDGQMMVSDRSREKIEAEAVKKQSQIEFLSDHQFEKDKRNLEGGITRFSREYNAVRPYIIRKNKLAMSLVSQLDSGQELEKNEHFAQYKIDSEEGKSVSFKNNLNSAEQLVKTIRIFVEQYRLEVPALGMGIETIIENFSPEQLLQMVMDVRDAELYRAKDALGK